MTEIRGTVAPGFEGVKAAFERNFVEHGEVGAAFAVHVDGELVVDLTGGVTTAQEPYDDRTLQMVFSTTKGATALCAHLLAQRGELDLDAPVVEYWPEFGAKGKEQVPVSWLLSHRSGLVDTEARLTYEEMLDWDTVTAALADTTPLWEPGTQHGYHAVTYGWLVGEVVRRVAGTSIGELFAKEVAGPLGLDFWIGTPEEQHARVSKLIPMRLPEGMPVLAAEEGASTGDDSPPAGLVKMLDQLLGPGNLAGRALSAPGGAAADEQVWNEPRTWSAQIPAANGVTNAVSLSRMYAAMVGEVDGIRLLDEATLEAAIQPQVEGPDAVLMFPIPFALGFMRHSDFSPFAGPRSFGHYGAGGSVGFADPDRRLAVGYTMNQMHFGLAGDPRTAALIAAVDAAVPPAG
ncbi:MAG TPA: serine hydrolase domain-containing protein [Microthrixaceae bacterium]|nr:serine hydrolase domain-containing protein [Microthrixaceae bacterium]